MQDKHGGGNGWRFNPGGKRHESTIVQVPLKYDSTGTPENENMFHEQDLHGAKRLGIKSPLRHAADLISTIKSSQSTNSTSTLMGKDSRRNENGEESTAAQKWNYHELRAPK